MCLCVCYVSYTREKQLYNIRKNDLCMWTCGFYCKYAFDVKVLETWHSLSVNLLSCEYKIGQLFTNVLSIYIFSSNHLFDTGQNATVVSIQL